MKSLAFSFLLSCIFSSFSFSQKNFYKEAERLYNNGEYFAAIDLYKSGGRVPLSIKRDALYKIGLCYFQIFDYKRAEVYFQKTIRSDSCNYQAYNYLSDCQKWLMKYDEAIVTNTQYMRLVPDAGPGISFNKSCSNAKYWIDNPSHYNLKNVVLLNSKDWEMSVSFADTSYTAIYLTSTRGGPLTSNSDRNINSATGCLQGIIFLSLHQNDSARSWQNRDTKEIDTTNWSLPLWQEWKIPNSISNDFINYYPKDSILNVSQKVQFVRKKKKRCSYKLINLFLSNKNKTDVVVLPFCYNDTADYNFISPFTISRFELLFSSDMPGGYGGYDLWWIKYDSLLKKWNEPKNLGPDINTSANEKFPFVRNDGTLYFASDNYTGMGGFDIYKAEQVGKDKWLNSQNMQYPLNSPQDDWGIIFEGMKEKGYLISNRFGGKGGFDIYSFELKK